MKDWQKLSWFMAGVLFTVTLAFVILAGVQAANAQSFTAETTTVPTYSQEEAETTTTPVTVTRGIVPYVKRHHARHRDARQVRAFRRALYWSHRLRRREVRRGY